MRLGLRDLLFLGFPEPILAVGQDLVFVLCFSSSFQLVLTLAQAVCPVDFCCSRVPSPG
jgi:hypothetical protein